jgi:hypothetical protein
MKKKFPRWATNKIQENIIHPDTGERVVTFNVDENRITEDFMNTGWLSTSFPTHTDFNTILHLIADYLNKPEVFTQNNLPAATDLKYKNRIIAYTVGQATSLLYSNGTAWKAIQFTDIG